MLGSNEGDREHLLQGAVEHIGRLAGKPEAISSIYETEAWGNTNQAPFLNQAVVIQTALQAPDLLAALLSIEDALGRKRGTRWAPRTIDIDILFYGDHIIQDFTLKIPHPEIASRRFVLEPLAELLPSFVHPVHHMDMKTLLALCPDPLGVRKVS